MKSLAIISNSAGTLLNFRASLIRDIVALDVEVFALAPDYDETARGNVRALGAVPVDISLDRARTSPLGELRDLLKLVRTLRRLKPDAMFAYFAKPVIYGTIAAWLAGVPRRYAMIEGLGYVFANGPRQKPLRRVLKLVTTFLYRLAFNRADRVVFLNNEDRDVFVEKGAIASAKALNIGGIGVDLARLSPAQPVLSPPTFLLMARLLREKGIVEYAQAARIVRARHPHARFVLLGGLDSHPDGLARQEVQSWVDEGVLEWGGQVADVRPWIAESSVFVLPSYYREGVPRSTQEAMAMARPVITTDNVGCRDTVIHGVNGFLVPKRDVGALAEAMTAFIDDPGLIASMGTASRRLAEERFDERDANRKLLTMMGLVRG